MFSGRREIYNYKNSFIQITLVNSTQINIPYNETTQEAELFDQSLSGQNISAVLYRTQTDLKDLMILDTLMAVEISNIKK